MANVQKIMVDVERMRYPFTGLYYYCLHLGNALLQQQHLHNAQLGFYLNEQSKSLFGKKSFSIVQHSLDKHHMSFARKFNIWHCTYQNSNYFPATLKTKVILTIHDINFLHDDIPQNKQKKFLDKLQKKINRADAIITISEFVKSDVLKNFNVQNKNLHVIYNGCNIADDIELLKPLFAPSAPFIFTISAIDKKKNFHVLPNLLLNNDYFLIIAGKTNDENYKNAIIDAAKKLNVESRVLFTGAIKEEEKYWYLKNCMVFVFPSIAEGFGLPVIEAMHFGKPVLLSKATSLPEIGGNLAYYFDDFDPVNMQKKLDQTLNEYSMKKNAFEISEWSKKFTWTAAAERHWQLYESLLNNKL